MMNKKNIYKLLIVGLLGLTVACTTATDPTPSTDVSAETLKSITDYGTSKGLTFTKSADGIFYAISTPNPTGRVPLANEYVKVHYTYTKLDGTVLDSTAVNLKVPLAFPYLSYNTLLNYGVGLLKEGETGTFVFPVTTNSAEPTALKATLLSTRNETEQINEYAADKFAGTMLKKTASGIQYLITKSSATGDSVKTAKSAIVNYTGKLLFKSRGRDTNGFYTYSDQFDTGSFTFALGQSAVVPGFEEAAKLLKVGDKGIFIFPSSLGYGTKGSFNSTTGLYTINPYTPLLFEIEVTGVVK
jgi:FKBP-type peptidyl-prolyl cis-trans isomerase